MRRPRPLPEALRSGPFSIAEAATFGVSAGRLDARDLLIPFAGVRDFAVSRDDDPEDPVNVLCRQFALRMKPWQFFSHDTALALYGAPLPMGAARTTIHVAAHRPAREPRMPRVVGHRLGARAPATRLVRGYRVESPARAWRQVGAAWRHDDLVAAADFLIARPWLATLEELAAEVGEQRGRGSETLARALTAVRPGAESSEETRLRLVLARAGLPEPEVNWTLHDAHGRFVARLDLAYPEWRVAPEYDGRQHAEDDAQFARDADRWHDVRQAGWHLVRVLRHHMRDDDGAQAVRMVRDALLAAGWRP